MRWTSRTFQPLGVKDYRGIRPRVFSLYVKNGDTVQLMPIKLWTYIKVKRDEHELYKNSEKE